MRYYKANKLDRKNGPAIIEYYNIITRNKLSEEYYKNNKHCANVNNIFKITYFINGSIKNVHKLVDNKLGILVKDKYDISNILNIKNIFNVDISLTRDYKKNKNTIMKYIIQFYNNNKIHYIRFYKNNDLHSFNDNIPSIIIYNKNQNIINVQYHKDNKLSRIDKPAYILYHNNGVKKQYLYYINNSQENIKNELCINFYDNNKIHNCYYSNINNIYNNKIIFKEYYRTLNIKHVLIMHIDDDIIYYIKYIFYKNNKIKSIIFYDNFYKFHNDKGPSIIMYYENGNINKIIYYKHGILTSDNNIQTYINFDINNNLKKIIYYKNGNIHNLNGPAYIELKYNQYGDNIFKWYDNNELCNIGYPSIIIYDNEWNIKLKSYFISGFFMFNIYQL